MLLLKLGHVCCFWGSCYLCTVPLGRWALPVQALVSPHCALCQPQAAQLQWLMLSIRRELLQRSWFSVLSTCEQSDFAQTWKQWSCFYLWNKELWGTVHATHRAASDFTGGCMNTYRIAPERNASWSCHWTFIDYMILIKRQNQTGYPMTVAWILLNDDGNWSKKWRNFLYQRTTTSYIQPYTRAAEHQALRKNTAHI